MLSQPRMWRYNLVWRKDRVTGHLNAKRMPLRQHEDIIVFYDRQPVYHPQMTPCLPEQRNHGRRKSGNDFKNRCYGNMKLVPVRVADDKYPTSVISVAKEHKTGAFYHPTQKPVALMEYLIRTYTNEGDVVLDNCIGSARRPLPPYAPDGITSDMTLIRRIATLPGSESGRNWNAEAERKKGNREKVIRKIK